MVATSFDLSQIRTDATAYSSSFRNLIGLGSSATLNAASANGVATLDGTGKLSAAQIPDISLVSYLGSVASQAAMLALSGQQGDWCVRSDLSTTWVITGNDPTQLSSWTQLSYPAVPVQSVFGRTGAVVGVSTDYSAVGIDSTAIGASNPSTGAFTTLSGTKATLSTGTITASTPAVDISQTWNSSGVTFTGSKINITDTSSASGSLLADWQVGGVSQTNIRKDGQISVGPIVKRAGISGETFSLELGNGINAGSSNHDYIRFKTNWGDAAFRHWGGRLAFYGTGTGEVVSPTFRVDSTGIFAWASGSAFTQSSDLILARDAAGILAQRNLANAQTFRIYNTTDSGIANYERAKLAWESNTFVIGTEIAGTSVTPRNIAFTGGNVLIGTTSPFASVVGWGGANQVRKLFVCDTSASKYTTIVVAGGDSTSGGGAIQFTSGDGTPIADFGFANATGLEEIGFAARNNNASINFYTTPSGTSPVNRLKITKEGNVGIGTTSPFTGLHIRKSFSTGGIVTIGNDSVTGYSSLDLRNYNDVQVAGFGYGNPNAASTNLADKFYIYTNSKDIVWSFDNGASNSITYKSNGNVGIATTSPAAKLDILDTTSAGSGSLAASTLNIASTWNTSGTPTLIKCNLTDTSSNAASLLMDLQVGGVSRFAISHKYMFGSSYTTRAYFSSSALIYAHDDAFGFTFYGQNSYSFGRYGGLTTKRDFYFGWTNAQYQSNIGTNDPSTGLPAVADLTIYRDAAGTLAQRNSTNAQRFNLYGTYTDASNYRRLYLDSTTAGAFTIGVEGLGTGASGNTLTVVGSGGLTIGSHATRRLFMDTDGSSYFDSTASGIRLRFNGNNRVIIGSVTSITNGLEINAANEVDRGLLTAGATTLNPVSLTGSSATSALDISQTWNTTGTPTLIKANVTDTASNAASLLLDLQVGGSRRFGIDKTGWIQIRENAYSGIVFADINNNRRLVVTNSILYAPTTITLASAGDPFTNNDVQLSRDAANTLAQRNSTNAQTYRLYGTYTDASNYERLALSSTTYSSAKYATIAAESAGTGAANINMVVSPKGTGAFMLSVPDGTATGGSARGQYAVDLQMSRTNASYVASGNYSVVLGGQSNRATGAYSVAFGSATIASGSYSFSTGRECNASGDYSFATGGFCNATGFLSATIGYCNASQYSSLATGVFSVADRYAMYARASGSFAGTTTGDAQTVSFTLFKKTTDATATTLMLDGSTTRLTIPSGKVFAFVAKISGIKSDGSAVAFYTRKGCIKNVGGATSLVGSIETIGTDTEDNAATDVAITADDTNDALQINVTGIAAETWRWVAVVEGIEIGYGT